MPSPDTTWRAELRLNFRSIRRAGEYHTLLSNRHQGPLRLQKALYPEGSQCCQAIILHPPGGIAGGDELAIKLSVARHAHAIITTPGATKWYGSHGPVAIQRVHMNIRGDLEWLPQEGIVFDRALAASLISMSVAPSARMLGWDGLVMGRGASGERFVQGHFAQSIRLRLDGLLEWEERLNLDGEDRALASPLGLNCQSTTSSIWAVLRDDDYWTEEDQSNTRRACPDIAWSILSPRLLVGRLLSDSWTSRQSRINAWRTLRPRVLAKPAVPLRIWAT